MIELKDISKKYKGIYVLSDINLVLPDKGCIAFVGPNGCGKSMLLNIICGFVRPSSGFVSINKKHYDAKREFIENAGIIINTPDFIPDLSIKENLIEVSKILNLSGTIEKIDELLELFNLTEISNKKYSVTSLGMKQKMRLIQALMEEKDIYIFDEPTNALDKESIKIVREKINELKKDKLVLITSHNEIDVETTSDRIYEMHEGRLI